MIGLWYMSKEWGWQTKGVSLITIINMTKKELSPDERREELAWKYSKWEITLEEFNYQFNQI